MKKIVFSLILVLLMGMLAACGNGDEDEKADEKNQGSEEVKSLNVDFNVPDKTDAGEAVELKAIVTYGDDKVKDATEVKFEYWEKGNEDDSTEVESTNNEDGTYTAEVTFDSDGVYEIYAHTSAKALHTMPKKSITVGDAESSEQEENNNNDVMN